MNKQAVLKPLIILFAIILPSLLLLLGFWVFIREKINPPSSEVAEVEEEVLKPSQLVENKLEYRGQRWTIRGKVDQAPMVCEKKECPEEDSCCGCESERDLIITDADAVIVQETVWRLKLLGLEGESLCQREENSCHYQCPGWEEGNVYDVTGIFYADPPPAGTGWRLYSDFHFEVEEMALVKKTGWSDIPKRFFKGIQELFQQLTKSGSYVLP